MNVVRIIVVCALLSLPLPAAAYQVFVKTLTGVTLTLEVQASDSVNAVKQQIFTKAGFPVAQQVLVFGGKYLAGGETLEELGIGSETTLYMIGCNGTLVPDSQGEVHWASTVDSPTSIACPTVVPKGVTLIIEPGSYIKVQRSVEGTALKVLGKIKLQASDPQTAPITFVTSPYSATTVLSIEPESGTGVVDDLIRGVIFTTLEDTSEELQKTTFLTTALRLALNDGSAPLLTASQINVLNARFGVVALGKTQLQIDGLSRFERNPTAITVGEDASLILLASTIVRSQQGIVVSGNAKADVRRSVFETVVDRTTPSFDPFTNPDELFGAVVVNGPGASAEVWFSSIDLRGVSIDKPGLFGLRVEQGSLTAYNNTLVRQTAAGESTALKQAPGTTLTARGNLVVGFSLGLSYQSGASLEYNAVQPASSGCAYFSSTCADGAPPSTNTVESKVTFLSSIFAAKFQLPSGSPVQSRLDLSLYSPQPEIDISGWPLGAKLHVGAFQNPIVNAHTPPAFVNNECNQTVILEGVNLLDTASLSWTYKTGETTGVVDMPLWADPADPLGSKVYGTVSFGPAFPLVNLQALIAGVIPPQPVVFEPRVAPDGALIGVVNGTLKLTTIDPTPIKAGTTQTFTITGGGFKDGAQVSFVFTELRGSSYLAEIATIEASSVKVESPGLLRAVVTFPASAPGGQWETRVTNVQGVTDVVPLWACIPVGTGALTVEAKPNQAPTKPVVTAPALVDGERKSDTGEVSVTSTDDTPVWGKTLTYTCTYATDAQFSDPIVVTSTDGTCRPDTSGWTADSTYYVKVVVSDGALESEPSDTFTIHYKAADQPTPDPDADTTTPGADMTSGTDADTTGSIQVEKDVTSKKGGGCAIGSSGNPSPFVLLALLLCALALMRVRRTRRPYLALLGARRRRPTPALTRARRRLRASCGGEL